MKSDITVVKTEKFWKNLYQRCVRQEIPVKTSFELTYKCNLCCCHCRIIGSKKLEISKVQDELSCSEVYHILDQLAEIGCFHLNLTGGEPLTRPDIFKILAYAKRKGFYIILLTNATLITPQIANKLKDLRIDQVDISFYGITPNTHERITRIPGSFASCSEAIQLLRQRNINISIKMMVMALNLNEFAQVKTFADNLGVRFQWDYLITPGIDGSKDPLAFRISPEEVMDLELSNQPHLSEKEKNAFFYCDAGKNSLAITPYGKMNLCLEYRFPQYDLRRGSIAQGWKELVNHVKSVKPTSTYQCEYCKLKEFCQWCPAVGLLEKGDRSACVPYFRELAELRRKQVKEGKN